MDDESQMLVTVLIADSQPIVRAGFVASLPTYKIKIIGNVDVPENIINCHVELQPDVLILGLYWNDTSVGLSVAEALLEKSPGAQIIFLGPSGRESIIKQCYKIGAMSFIPKETSIKDIATVILEVKRGKIYFTPDIANFLANISVMGGQSPKDLLGLREFHVFMLMAKGFTATEIAKSMDLSIKTITNTSVMIKSKINLDRQIDITRIAIKNGLLDP